MAYKIFISLSTLISCSLILFPTVESQSHQPHSENIEQVSYSNTQGPSHVATPALLRSLRDSGYKYMAYQKNKGSIWNSIISTLSRYPREMFGTNRDASGNPILGLSSSSDFKLSAYFGPLFWASVTLVTTIMTSLWIIKFFTGTDVIGNIAEKIRGPSGKAMDLDHLTNVVYEAFEKYGNWGMNNVSDSSPSSKS